NSLLYGIKFLPPKLDLNIEMKGLKEFVKTLPDGTVVKEHPSVAITYYTFRIMIFLGTFFALIALAGLYLWYRNGIENPLFLKVLMYSWPLPFIANTAGWFTAEVGRQPYVIYGVLKTSESFTPGLSAFNVGLTIVVLLVLYVFLTYVAYYLITKFIKEFNPVDLETEEKISDETRPASSFGN
ncbi:MAG: cytochrome ubiquinol oxidase subunit I, partial [bacterium]